MADDAAAQAQAAAAQAKEDAKLMREAASDPTKIHVVLDAEFEKKNYLKCHQKLMEVFFLNPNLETGWRFTRVCYMLSVTAAGQHELNYLKEGWGTAQKYLKMEGGMEHPHARKWAGIILGSVADNYKPKEKVAASQEIREHLEACLAKIPGDAAAQHALGMYCFNVAGIGWLEKTAAKVIFGKELKSSYEEALVHFQKAAGEKPWPKNDWMMAKCLAKQKAKNLDGAKALIAKIMASDDGEAFADEIGAFCKKYKITM